MSLGYSVLPDDVCTPSSIFRWQKQFSANALYLTQVNYLPAFSVHYATVVSVMQPPNASVVVYHCRIGVSDQSHPCQLTCTSSFVKFGCAGQAQHTIYSKANGLYETLNEIIA
jgi:hypothetical protein